MIKKWLNRVFIDGLSGMAMGLFATLIVGTIISQIGTIVGGETGNYLVMMSSVAKVLTGAGIGVGVAHKYGESPLVTVSAASAGMIGAFASKLLAGEVIVEGALHLTGAGEPLGAFIAAYVGIELGHLVSGKTKLDILVTPMVTILLGGMVGLFVGPPISQFMAQLGAMIQWGTEQQPFLMGIIVSVLMGMILTLPISSAALGVVLNLSGIAAGAAAVGCSTQMVGFAVASFKENKFGGLVAQGIGTSMLQVPNIVRKPLIWVPPTLASAILGPVSTIVLKMTNNAIGSGMGTAGLVGQIMGYQTMVGEGLASKVVLIEIIVMHVIAPAILTYVIAEFMRRKGLIKDGDMKLDL
ncbi:MAG: PTS sugar transporter subunit IIC [Anaerostipes sp.]|uniref:PTS transporter subunit IIC n=1 Tax=Anaerostipes sp. 992a TaxID=1261637 RepID=UPI0009528EFC|nr:PTS sugar transporter subunit IIC [Anaerostipes sp. 992a]MCI5951225.1 PTS sugar transporter subunit IIC [Anaerostipes sp.]MDD5968475.1 PTS sugar transporter subunit IIC [Anaerostipes sp.]OLR58150.1 PTS sugar transporter subunit IIC [Anaerostipes sp. 992a]